MRKSMKKRLLIIIAALLLFCAAYLVYCLCSYHAQPELVKELAWSDEVEAIVKDEMHNGVVYHPEIGTKLFSQAGIMPRSTYRFFEIRPMLPLILRGRKIKQLSSGWFSTDEVRLEFAPGKPYVLYCYYIDERYNNVLTGYFR